MTEEGARGRRAGQGHHKGSHLRGVVEAGEIQRHTAIPGLELAHFFWHNGPPERADPARCKLMPPFRELAVHGKRIRNVCACSEVFEAADRSVWDKALAA